MQLHRADGRTAEWEPSLLLGKKKTGISPGWKLYRLVCPFVPFATMGDIPVGDADITTNG
jgi:hypothetical protein